MTVTVRPYRRGGFEVDIRFTWPGGKLVMVLLGGDAGLRRSEMVSLRQSDVDFRRRQLHVRLATWQGIEDTPKGGRARIIPLTVALTTALSDNRHLRGDRVLHQDDGRVVNDNVLQHWMEAATRRAGLAVHRSLHILKHTFCTRLSMKGAAAKAIQELAGHQSLSTTLRYMHLSPSARESAIQLLDGPVMGLDHQAGSVGGTEETYCAGPA